MSQQIKMWNYLKKHSLLNNGVTTIYLKGKIVDNILLISSSHEVQKVTRKPEKESYREAQSWRKLSLPSVALSHIQKFNFFFADCYLYDEGVDD